MGIQQLEELIRLIEQFRHGVSLARLLNEDSRWDKKTLQKGLKDLAVKNKITVLGNGKTVRYFATSQERSEYLPIGSSYEKKSRKHEILSIGREEKWSFVSKYITRKDFLSVRKCAKAIFTGSSCYTSKSLRHLEENSRHFSEMKRLTKQKSDIESHRVLNPKVNFIVLNI